MGDKNDYAIAALRILIGAIFLWFGIEAVMDPAGQLHWLADWVVALPLVGSEWFLLLIGIAEIIVGLLLVTGFYARYAAFAGAALLFGVVVNLGVSQLGMRDLIIMVALLVIGTSPKLIWTKR